MYVGSILVFVTVQSLQHVVVVCVSWSRYAHQEPIIHVLASQQCTKAKTFSYSDAHVKSYLTFLNMFGLCSRTGNVL